MMTLLLLRSIAAASGGCLSVYPLVKRASAIAIIIITVIRGGGDVAAAVAMVLVLVLVASPATRGDSDAFS